MDAIKTEPQPKMSVIVPVYKGIRWIGDCLDSLAAQTLADSDFEIVLIFNGPDDGSLALAQAYRDAHPTLEIQLLSSDVASAARARNVGTNMARGVYVTWLDCDDWISPEYLELLLTSARDGVVPLAQIVNVSPDGSFDDSNLINSSILGLDDHLPSPSSFPRALSFMTCKLLTADMARAVPFDETLRSGEDVAVYAGMYARYDFRISTLPALAGAKYYRRLSEDSVSRQPPTYDFLVTQRLDVISSLNRSLAHSRPEARPLITSFINSQASFVRRFFNSHPEDRTRISEDLVRRNFTYFPWINWFDDVERLVVAFNFLPYADTGAMVMAKRIREIGEGVDVISHRMDNVRKAQPENLSVGRPYVQRAHSIPGPAYFGSPLAISDFVRKGLGVIKDWEAQGRIYKEVYSRCMWPASHYLAAAYKIQRPDVRWVAEFSDPVQIDSAGLHRVSALNDDSLFDDFIKAAEAMAKRILKSARDVYAWTEYIPYIFADELVFTNKNQMEFMISYADPVFHPIIRAKAVVKEQPTLAPAFYDLVPGDFQSEDGKINIGYFGQFYATRGLNEVIEAIAALPDNVKNVIRLHIFTSGVPAAKSSVDSLGLTESVRINEQLPYFEFLNTAKKFDCLLVNDAQTEGVHEINPYLPSKLSDYVGSGTDIWAIVESGSVLSSLSTTYQTEIGDVPSAVRVLMAMAGAEISRI